jgi:RNA polymerase sigma factor for flagellar operon FliA
MDERYLLGCVEGVMRSSNSYELVDVVSKAIANEVHSRGLITLAHDEEALVRSLGLAGRRTRTLEHYLVGALSKANASQRARGRKLLAATSQMKGLRRLIIENVVLEMTAAPATALDEVCVQLLSEGIDSDHLRWSVVGVEARRHVPLVLKEANRAARNWPDRGADGLIGYAWQGLRLALYNYDPERGTLSTYACPRIRGAIRDGIRAESHLPKRLTTFVHKVDRARESLTQSLGRHPSLEEVAKSMDLSLEKLGTLHHLGTPVSLNDLVERDGSFAVVASEDPEAAAIESARRSDVASALASLDPEDALVVRLMVLQGLGVGECQARTGMSARQLRSRKERGLEELAEKLEAWASA